MGNKKAFPYSDIISMDSPTDSVGMDLRDYFAAAAMQAIITGGYQDTEALIFQRVAEKAYQMADAMMREREK